MTSSIPLNNRLGGPYRKLRTEFFSLRFMAQARSTRARNRRGKGSVTYDMDREDEVSKSLITQAVSLGLVFGFLFFFPRSVTNRHLVSTAHASLMHAYGDGYGT